MSKIAELDPVKMEAMYAGRWPALCLQCLAHPQREGRAQLGANVIWMLMSSHLLPLCTEQEIHSATHAPSKRKNHHP